MERFQEKYHTTHFVKVFSCVVSAHMVHPDLKEGKPSMFIAGNSDEAKGKVAEILNAFNWDIQDMGKVEAARATEPLCMLWCIPGFLKNEWNHAFRLLVKQGALRILFFIIHKR
jgi:predicted dinucleotide-binding enzyme